MLVLFATEPVVAVTFAPTVIVMLPPLGNVGRTSPEPSSVMRARLVGHGLCSGRRSRQRSYMRWCRPH